MNTARIQHHDRELLSDVFDAAYKAMTEAIGTTGVVHWSEYVTPELISSTARKGADKAMRELLDKARS